MLTWPWVASLSSFARQFTLSFLTLTLSSLAVTGLVVGYRRPAVRLVFVMVLVLVSFCETDQSFRLKPALSQAHPTLW